MSAATSPLVPDFYTWGFSNSPIQVHLYLDVVSRIRKQIEDSEKDTGVLSGCGLLTGDVPKPGITSILAFEPLQVLDAASAGAASASAQGAVVGFYRTTPIGSISMLDEDKTLALSLFSHPSAVFLLIETGKFGIGDARFCFWSEHELFDWPLMLFPFDAKELAAGAGRKRSRVKVPVLAPAKVPVKAPAEPGVEDVSPVPPAGLFPVWPADQRQESIAPAPDPITKPLQGNGRRRLAMVLATVAAAAVSVFAFVYFTPRANLPSAAPVAPPAAPARADVTTPFGLAVEKRGANLVISWNGNAPEISKASFGMLLIRGAKVGRDVPLTAEELRAGRLVYAAPADQVRFQLNVVVGEQVTRESLTVVLPANTERRASLTSPPAGNSNAAERLPPVVWNRSAPVPELRPFQQVEYRNPAAPAAVRLDEPPPVAGTTPVHSATLAVLNQAPVSLPAPVDTPAQGIPQRETPLLAVKAHPPVAIRQVVPSVPSQLRGLIWAATAVDVNVSVDATGSVVKAEAVAKPGLHPLLGSAAVQAARRWKFQAAQFNGHPVPANIVLQFSFAANR